MGKVEFTRNGLMIFVWDGSNLVRECKEIIKSVMVYDLQRMNTMIRTASKRYD